MKAGLTEIIMEFRGSTTFALVLCTVWLLLSATYSQTLDRRELARDLLGYLLLRDAVASIPESDFPSGTDELAAVCTEIMDARSPQTVCPPLTLTAPWDPDLKVRFKLRSLPGFSQEGGASDMGAYSVIADELFGALSEYSIGRFHGKTAPIHDVTLTVPRFVADAINANDDVHKFLRSPRLWNRTRVLLSSLGTSAAVEDVKLSDPVVNSLIVRYLSEGGGKEIVAGLPIPVLLLPYGIATLLTIGCCLFVGTWAALRSIKPNSLDEGAGWAMLQVGKDDASPAIEIAAHVLGAVILVVPAAALAQTIRLGLKVPPWADLFALGTLATALSLLLLIMVGNVFELLRLRRAMARKLARS